MSTLYITPKSEDGETVKEMFHFMEMTLPGVITSEALVVTGLPADLASSLSRSLSENGHAVQVVESEAAPVPKPEPVTNIQPEPKPKRQYKKRAEKAPEPQQPQETPAPAPFVYSTPPGTTVDVRISPAVPAGA